MASKKAELFTLLQDHLPEAVRAEALQEGDLSGQQFHHWWTLMEAGLPYSLSSDFYKSGKKMIHRIIFGEGITWQQVASRIIYEGPNLGQIVGAEAPATVWQIGGYMSRKGHVTVKRQVTPPVVGTTTLQGQGTHQMVGNKLVSISWPVHGPKKVQPNYSWDDIGGWDGRDQD